MILRTLLLATAASAIALAAPVSSSNAQALASGATESRSLTLAKDKSVAFRLEGAVGELVVGQPDIAEIVAKTDHSFYIRGKKTGATNVLVYGPNQQLIEVIDVRVGPDAEALRHDLTVNMPGEKILVSNYADGLMLSGEVSNNAVATRAKAVALRYAPDAVSTNFSIHDPQQVVLEVRVIEAGRQALRDAGINLNIMGSNGSIVSGAGLLGITPSAGTFRASGTLNGVTLDATLQSLEDNGTIRTLAKPNLVALSGEEATFMAGGEFPLAVPQQLNIITIQFKPFGVQLKFTPEVQDNGTIRLKISPEVSAIDDTHPLQINGFNVPSLTVRKATTTVQMDPGKSFAIAGLLQQSDITSVRETPFLGDVPIIGSLFRSTRFNRQETELVIIVTPRLVNVDAPAPDPFHDGATPLRPDPSAPPVGETAQPGFGPVASVTSAEPARVAVAPRAAPPVAAAVETAPQLAVPPSPAPVAVAVLPAPMVAAAPSPAPVVAALMSPAPVPVAALPAPIVTLAVQRLPAPPVAPTPPSAAVLPIPMETVLTPVSTPKLVGPGLAPRDVATDGSTMPNMANGPFDRLTQAAAAEPHA